MSEKTSSGRTRFPFISAEAFVSPRDRAALSALQKTPMLPVLVRKFNEYAVDKIFYVRNSAESIRCGPGQFPTLYNMMREAAFILDVPEPELYVKYSFEYNAFTAGVNKTFITLHSSLIDGFTDEELMFVIGHELGHIKCGHVLYQMMGRMLIPLLEVLGDVTLGVGRLAGAGLVTAFFEWLRQAEFSCDRAGLLVSQSREASFSAVMKLGCGSTRYNGEMNVDAFLEQARHHSEQSGLEGVAKALLFVLYTWELQHPQVVFRGKGLDEWDKSGAFDTIMGGRYSQDATGGSQLGVQRRCKGCDTMVSSTVRFCPNCGNDLNASGPAKPAPSGSCASCGAALARGAKFCADCGAPVP